MQHTRMTTLAFILSEIIPLDGFRCNFVSTPKLENHLEYFDDTLFSSVEQVMPMCTYKNGNSRFNIKYQCIWL